MPVEQATAILSSLLSLLSLLVDFAGQLVNPLDQNSTFADWLFAIIVVSGVAFTVVRLTIDLAAGRRGRRR